MTTRSYLLQVELMTQDQAWTVLCSTQKHNSFIETDTAKNVFGSYYHVREPQTQELQMTFAEYAECAQKWTTRTVLFKVCVSRVSCNRAKIHLVRKAGQRSRQCRIMIAFILCHELMHTPSEQSSWIQYSCYCILSDTSGLVCDFATLTSTWRHNDASNRHECAP